jgi:hypothetical protein
MGRLGGTVRGYQQPHDDGQQEPREQPELDLALATGGQPPDGGDGEDDKDGRADLAGGGCGGSGLGGEVHWLMFAVPFDQHYYLFSNSDLTYRDYAMMCPGIGIVTIGNG